MPADYPKLIEFIREARKRGFKDWEIKEPLLKNGWPLQIIEDAFNYLEPKHRIREQLVLYLDTKLIEKLNKRAKRNMMKIDELIEDILRRSTLNQRKTIKQEKLDDRLVGLFSRKRTGRKKKKRRGNK